MKNIHESISGLNSLKNLPLNGSFTTIPDRVFQLGNIEEINLKSQYLSSIPDKDFELNSLKRLSIKGSFSKIPKSISKLNTLTNLSLEGSFNGIPESMSEMVNLKELTLYSPNLTELPKSITAHQYCRFYFLNNTLNSNKKLIRKIKKNGGMVNEW